MRIQALLKIKYEYLIIYYSFSDNMSPEIPKLVHTSTLGNNARRSVINQREKAGVCFLDIR